MNNYKITFKKHYTKLYKLAPSPNVNDTDNPPLHIWYPYINGKIFKDIYIRHDPARIQFGNLHYWETNNGYYIIINTFSKKENKDSDSINHIKVCATLYGAKQKLMDILNAFFILNQ